MIFRAERFLLSRDYKPSIIDSAIGKARNVPRREALKKVHIENSSSRPVFVIHYDPRLPSIPAIVQKHWRTMIQDPRIKEVFPAPPLVAYKRPQNIREKLIRSKVPTIKRELPGMKKCSKCSVCPFVKEGRTIQSKSTNLKIDINTNANCSTKNIIYLLVITKT